jgi:hypothetical protein
MSGCKDCPPVEEREPQHAVGWAVYLSGDVVVEGAGRDDWLALRDRCFVERRFVLTGRVRYNDGTARNFGGWSWTYLIQNDGAWTIDDDASAERVLVKYRDLTLIPGGTVTEAEMQRANNWQRELS